MIKIVKLKEGSYIIKFSSLGDVKDIQILGYPDGSYPKLNNIDTGIVIGLGIVLFLKGVNNEVNILDWSGRKTKVPTSSALAAEGETALELYHTSQLSLTQKATI